MFPSGELIPTFFWNEQPTASIIANNNKMLFISFFMFVYISSSISTYLTQFKVKIFISHTDIFLKTRGYM